MINNLTTALVYLTFFAMVSCFNGPDFMTQKNAGLQVISVETSESDGAISGSVSAKADSTQEISVSSGSLEGSSLACPPGSLAIDTEITLEEGSPIADSSASSLGVSSSVSSASNAVVVGSSEQVDPASAFTLQIPVSSQTGLALTQSTYLVVFYKVTKYGEGGKVVTGIMPHNQVSVENGKAKFSVNYFGVFQLAYIDNPVEQAKEVDSTSPILTKREEKKLVVISFSKIAFSANLVKRSVTVSAVLSDLSQLKQCVLMVDQDKQFPWDYKMDLSAPNAEFVATSSQGQSLYFRFVCGFGDGRVLQSDWSDIYQFGALSVNILGVPTAAIDANTEFEITASGDGVKEYKFAVGPGENLDCGKQTYSGWISLNIKSKIKSKDSGKISVCVQVRDYLNNESSVKRYAWTQNAVATESASSSSDSGAATVTPITLSVPSAPTLSPACLLIQNGNASFATGYSYSSATATVSGISPSSSPVASNSGYSFVIPMASVVPGTTFSAVWDVSSSPSASRSLTTSYSIVASAITESFAPPFASGIGYQYTRHAMVGLQVWEVGGACNYTGRLASLTTGTNHSCLTKMDGGVICWGTGGNGQLGDGTSTSQAYPVNVSGTAGMAVALGNGDAHSCAMLITGEVSCWGSALDGKLGHGISSGIYGSPVFVLNAGTDQATNHLTNIVAIATGFDHSCALKDVGVVKCWGRNDRSQTGMPNGIVQYSNPQPVSLPEVAVGVASGTYFSCALLSAGDINKVKCWGEQLDGRLGNGNVTPGAIDAPGFVKINATTSLTNVVGIALGDGHGCALLMDGKIRCWGRGASGQLGNNTYGSDSYSTTDVFGIGGTNPIAVAVAAGGAHSCAIMVDGMVKCWGDNIDGQLGNGTITSSSIPVNVIMPTGVRAVALDLGNYHSCMIGSDQKVYCWGNGINISNGQSSDVTSPVVMLTSGGGAAITNTGLLKRTDVIKN